MHMTCIVMYTEYTLYATCAVVFVLWIQHGSYNLWPGLSGLGVSLKENDAVKKKNFFFNKELKAFRYFVVYLLCNFIFLLSLY